MGKGLGLYILVQLFLLAQLPVAAGAETIYALVGDDGSISLSNVPTNNRYKPLVAEGKLWPVEAANSERRPVSPDPSARSRYTEVIDQTARTYGLESALLHAVISVESGYDPTAHSRKGAAGLMQLMPGTAKRYGVADVLDPVQNVQGGAKYLRDLLKLFDSDLNLALAAYNAGEKAVARYGNRIPPFHETENYVPRVLAYYRKYQANDHDAE